MDDYELGFDYSKFTPEEKKEFNRRLQAIHNYRTNHPLYKKALDIKETMKAILETFPENFERGEWDDSLKRSSKILPELLFDSIGSLCWQRSIQNAAVIRYHANDLLQTVNEGWHFDELTDSSYLNVLRDELIEFQRLFKIWVKEIDAMEPDDFEDDWGLFVKNGPYPPEDWE